MSMLPDLLLVMLVLGAALWTVAASERRSAVIGFIALGLLLALVWMRLYAVDVALTEAAVGGGATGLLLLRACARLDSIDAGKPSAGPTLQLLIGFCCAAMGVGIAAAALGGPDLPPTLAPAVAANIDAVGLGNPVTVVLLAYRAIDTLLEKIVLIAALVGVWSLAPDEVWGGPPASLKLAKASEPLTFLAQILPPVGFVIGVYLIWNGADEPGGTFQGGTVLAAMWLLVMLAGLAEPPETRRALLQYLVVFGPAVFLISGFSGFWLAEGFLSYPTGFAKTMIVALEVALALSIAVIVAMMLAGPSARTPR